MLNSKIIIDIQLSRKLIESLHIGFKEGSYTANIKISSCTLEVSGRVNTDTSALLQMTRIVQDKIIINKYISK